MEYFSFFAEYIFILSSVEYVTFFAFSLFCNCKQNKDIYFNEFEAVPVFKAI